MVGEITIRNDLGGITVYYKDNLPLYHFSPDGRLYLNATKGSLSDIKRRIPKTKEGLSVIVSAEQAHRERLLFRNVTAWGRFPNQEILALENIFDDGEHTLWDWLRNRKKYTYFVDLKPI